MNRQKRRNLSLCILFQLFIVATLQIIGASAQATSASLNDPSSATATPSRNGTSSNNTTSLPSSTDVIPVPLSGQQVPFLLSTPLSRNSSHTPRGQYFTGCSDKQSAGYVVAENRINISTVYTQIDRDSTDSSLGDGSPYSGGTLRIVGIGSIGNESYAFNNFTDSSGATRGLLSAIQVTTRFSTFQVFSNYTYLCNRLYPTQNDSQHPNVNPASCQYGPGTISFGIDIPLNSTYEAGTLMSEIRLTDSSSPALTIGCIEVLASPYYPQRWYWKMIMWLPVGLAISFFLLAFFATLITAETVQRSAFKNRAREGGAPKFVRDRLSPMVISALSGRGLLMSPALLRFITPGCWDIFFHLQFIVAIAMCHVQWPDFVYPFFRQVAWASLLGNITLTQPENLRYDPLSTNATLPSGDLGTAMTNPTSPLFMNVNQENVLLNLGDPQDGIQTYASIVGLQPENLFGTCLGVWLAIVGAILVSSLLIWIIDLAIQAHDRKVKQKEEGAVRLSSSAEASLVNTDEGKWGKKDRSRVTSTSSGATILKQRPTSRRNWMSNIGLHGKALHGNLLRVLVLFHLPITIMSTYQFSSVRQHSIVTIALAALAFAIFSVLLPIYIIVRLAKTPLQKLFEHVGTLLSLGPVYHNYSPGSQLFYAVSFAHSLILGLVVGAGQRSGAAQAIIILVIEVLAALASSLWLPWGEGAMMGPLSFMANVLRIITSVLVLLLTTLVGLGYSARSWVTYVVLLLQGIYLFGAILVLFVKLMETIVRLIWKVRFDERLSNRTAGLGGAIRKIKRRRLKNHHRSNSSVQLQRIKMEHRMSSNSTNTISHMLTNSQQIPMSDARTGNYNDYLESGRNRPISTTFSHYGGMDEESGHIMAALPPVSPGPGPGVAGDDVGNSFIRMGGGRASEGNPYTPFPSQGGPLQRPPAPHSRQMSHSGVVGTWGGGSTDVAPVKKIIDQKSSYHALARTPSHELSSTQAAALAATKSMRLEKRSERKKLRGMGLKWGKGKRTETEEEDEEEEEWSDEGTTWDSNAAARNKGAWSGVAKMSAAFDEMKKTILGGGGAKGIGSEKENDSGEAGLDTLTPSGSGGFEVVRANKFRPTASPAKQNMETQQAAGASQLSSSHMQKDSSAMTGQALSRPDFTRGHLGMLGADLERAPSSAGHTEEEAGEDRFWLPPLDIETEREGEHFFDQTLSRPSK